MRWYSSSVLPRNLPSGMQGCCVRVYVLSSSNGVIMSNSYEDAFQHDHSSSLIVRTVLNAVGYETFEAVVEPVEWTK